MIKIGNLIEWKTIDPEATYDKVRIYRSTNRDSGYVLIATQPITDYDYYDATGTTIHWYELDFYTTATGIASSMSDPIQGGTHKFYCTVEDVRNLTNLQTSDISDTQVANIIQYAGALVNADVQVYVIEEQLLWIDAHKQNLIDGTNATYYSQNYPIGDMDDDMGVDTGDITVYQYLGDPAGTRETLTVSSITPNDGSFVLSIPPPGTISMLTLTYKWSLVSMSDPHPLVKLATAYLAAAFAYSKINIGKAPSWSMVNVRIVRDMKSFETFYTKYQQVIAQINNRMANSMEGPGGP